MTSQVVLITYSAEALIALYMHCFRGGLGSFISPFGKKDGIALIGRDGEYEIASIIRDSVCNLIWHVSQIYL